MAAIILPLLPYLLMVFGWAILFNPGNAFQAVSLSPRWSGRSSGLAMASAMEKRRLQQKEGKVKKFHARVKD